MTTILSLLGDVVLFWIGLSVLVWLTTIPWRK